ncbi:MAG TPA: NHL domain-containing thioredoxin family protein [Candidatus Dormibacteraeota bacterium]|nr:NHL domain-containing thioredoxin family protein [Candidatus Dormibacteraeota bacterium]
MHTFPQLRKIERAYGDRLIVIGVHSPKFPAERPTANLREAVLRYRIEHPVVNDRDFATWQRFGGRAWPTLVFIDPRGRVVGKHEGELPFEQLDALVSGMLKDFEARDLLDAGAQAIPIKELREPDRTLSFPGKVVAASDMLVIADSNHHRIVVAGLDGSVRQSFGSGRPELVDGPAASAAFQQPQGIALTEGVLYVADTENHAIRSVDLKTGAVRTVAGTGAQALEAGGGPGLATPLSSPWDLALRGRTLYIAMAGLHQIWTLDLDTETVAPLAGTGREGLRDGLLDQAWFAQSSGLTLIDNHLFVADSEVSAVRDIDLAANLVTTIVGQDLFVFGDQDGEGDVVRLQHPLGIESHDGRLYLADSYNNKIKRIDPRRRTVTSWLGSGHAGRADGPASVASFREPGGVSAGEQGLYIADTNNHRIAFAGWDGGEVRTLIGA